ncbi:hypothetical protein D3C72_2088280 [compost metagenome]
MAGDGRFLVFGIERGEAGHPEVVLGPQGRVILDQPADAFVLGGRQQPEHILGHQGIAPVMVSADVITCAHAVRHSFSLMRLRRSQVRIVLSGTAKRVASSS